MNTVWEEKLKVKNYEVGPKGKLKLFSLFNYLQEIAGTHAESLGWGYDKMQQKGYFWVLSRMQVEISTWPEWGEELTIKTWPRGIERLYALRDFEVKNSKGERIIRAVSGWLVVDVNTHRLVKPDAITEGILLHASDDALEFDSGKMSAYELPIHEYERAVSYNDLDVNHHVNNARYMEWILEAYQIDFLKTHEISKIQLTYNKEAKYGDHIRLKLNSSRDDQLRHAVEAVQIESEQKIIQAVIDWKET